MRQARNRDPLTVAQRSYNMSRIRGRDTQPELLLRRGLHARGLRFRLHDRELPGSPDMVLPRHRAVIFINGCFWHGHDCPKGVTPASNTEFWTEKIERNRCRDVTAQAALLEIGWRILIVWECALRGRERLELADVLDESIGWLGDSEPRREIEGGIKGQDRG